MIYVFGEFEVDTERRELRRGGTEVEVDSNSFELLVYLVAHSDWRHDHSDVVSTVWSGQPISEADFAARVRTLQYVLGEATEQPRYIVFTPQHLRFNGPVQPREFTAARAVPFLGREVVLTELRAVLDDAFRGRSRLQLLVGEPGIGKTRTITEFAKEARQRGARVVTASAFEGKDSPPYWQWVQILREWLREYGLGSFRDFVGGDERKLNRLLPELESFPHNLQPRNALASEDARYRLFESIAALVQLMCRDRPVVFVFDDLHWSDVSSVVLMHYLAKQLRETKLLIVGTYRDFEVTRTAQQGSALGELMVLPGSRRTMLRGLSREAVSRMIREGTGQVASNYLVDQVFEMSAGNPFFVGEIVELLAFNGGLAAADSEIRINLPQGIRDAVSRRLGRLSSGCVQVLSAASIVGRHFDSFVLSEMLRLEPDELAPLLDEALAARIIRRSDRKKHQFDFSHALVSQFLNEGMTTPARVRMHQKIGQALEVVYRQQIDVHLDEIAFHYFQATAMGEVEKAVEFSVRAAERASKVLGFEEAVGHYTRALEALDAGRRVDENRAAEISLAKADAEWGLGASDAARDTCLGAAELARRAGRPDLLARAALGCSIPSHTPSQQLRSTRNPARNPSDWNVGSDEHMTKLLEEALGALPDDQVALRSRLLSRLVGTPRYAESQAQRVELSEQAIVLARRSEDPAAMMHALLGQGWAYVGPDYMHERIEIGRHLIEFADRLPSDRSEMRNDPRALGYDLRISAFLALGEQEAAKKEIDMLVRLAEQQRHPAYDCFAGWFLSGAALAEGRFDAARHQLQKNLVADVSLQLPDSHLSAKLVNAAQHTWLDMERDQSGVVDNGLQVLHAYASSLGPFLPPAAAYAHYARDATEAALQEFNRTAAIEYSALPRNEYWLPSMSFLAELCAIFGDAERARAVYALLEPYQGLVVFHDVMRMQGPPVSSFLGMLAGAMGDVALSTEHFENALQATARLGLKPSEIITRYFYARMLLAQSSEDAEWEARAILDEAEELATEIGSKHSLVRVRRLIAEKFENGPRQFSARL